MSVRYVRDRCRHAASSLDHRLPPWEHKHLNNKLRVHFQTVTSYGLDSRTPRTASVSCMTKARPRCASCPQTPPHCRTPSLQVGMGVRSRGAHRAAAPPCPACPGRAARRAPARARGTRRSPRWPSCGTAGTFRRACRTDRLGATSRVPVSDVRRNRAATLLLTAGTRGAAASAPSCSSRCM